MKQSIRHVDFHHVLSTEYTIFKPFVGAEIVPIACEKSETFKPSPVVPGWLRSVAIVFETDYFVFVKRGFDNITNHKNNRLRFQALQ
jgi:hypothetical protein